MNSSAALKAFCGRNGGIVCTSSNAATVLEWAFERGSRVLFFPDQHLGRNTAKAMGIPLEQIPMWNPRKPARRRRPQVLRDAKVLLWPGFCSVHKRFTVDQIEQARAQYPGVKVIVHPECPMPVVDAADACRLDRVRSASSSTPRQPGDVIAIGTEINMVNRLAAQYPGPDDLLPRPGHLPVLDDVPHPSGLPGLDARRSRRRRGPQRDRRPRRRRARRQGRARTDAARRYPRR